MADYQDVADLWYNKSPTNQSSVVWLYQTFRRGRCRMKHAAAQSDKLSTQTPHPSSPWHELALRYPSSPYCTRLHCKACTMYPTLGFLINILIAGTISVIRLPQYPSFRIGVRQSYHPDPDPVRGNKRCRGSKEASVKSCF